MTFSEAYKVEAEGVKLNENAFTEGRTLETSLNTKIDEVQGRLEEMRTIMEGDTSGDELKSANQAIKKELADSIPANFKSEYESTKDGNEADTLISQHILEGVNDFIASKLEGVIETTVDASIGPDDVKTFQGYYDKNL